MSLKTFEKYFNPISGALKRFFIVIYPKNPLTGGKNILPKTKTILHTV